MDKKIGTGKLAGNTFFEVLGISKQYLPLYQKFNVSLSEHHIIQLSRFRVSEKIFLKLRVLNATPFIISILGTPTIGIEPKSSAL